MTGLVQKDYAVVPTPSGFVDAHFPDGNDGLGAIPLVWASVIPDYVQKQEGTPFSVDLFANFLQQPGGATASLTPGSSLGSGWSLNSSGTLSFSGTGRSSGTIRVRATYGSNTADSPPFNYESIAQSVSSDLQAPTIPTGLALVSKTSTSITVLADGPSDVPTTGIPASGNKEIRWYKGGVLDGTTSLTQGLLLQLGRVDISLTTAREFTPGTYVAISEAQSVSRIPNAPAVNSTGPCCHNVVGFLVRREWGPHIETTPGQFDVSSISSALADCASYNTASAPENYKRKLWVMIVTRTFNSDTTNKAFTADVRGATSGTLTASTANGTYNFLLENGDERVVTVTSGTHAAWSGAITNSASQVKNISSSVAYTTCPMPTDLVNQADIFTAGTGQQRRGWQGRRWNATVLARWDALMQGMYAKLKTDPNFDCLAGFATQETATGTPPSGSGYTPTAFRDALMAESDSIVNAFPTKRHLFFFNSMSGTSNSTFNTYMTTVLDHLLDNDAVVGFPDLVMKTGTTLNNRNALLVQAYHTGAISSSGHAGGATQGSIQSAEFTTIAPADDRTIATLFAYAVGTTADDKGNKYYRIDQITPDWHNQASPPDFQNFDDVVAVLAGHTYDAPYGDYVATGGGGITAGTLTQSGVDYDILSYGTGVGTTADSWSAGTAAVNNDTTIIVKLNSITGTDTSSAGAGVTFRENAAADAAAVHVVVNSSQVRMRYRPTKGAATTTLVSVNGQNFATPKWLKLVRVKTGDSFTGYYSNGDTGWVLLGTISVSMVPSVQAQLFGFAGAAVTPITAHFQQVNIQSPSSNNGNFDPSFVPSNYYYVDLNATSNGTGLTPSSPKNVLPGSITNGMQLFFNSDNGVQTINEIENVFSLGTVANVQIASYGSGKAVISGYRKFVNDSGWSVSSGNVWKRTYASVNDGGGRPIVANVINMSDTTGSPQGTVLKWVDASAGGFNFNGIASGYFAYDVTNHIMYINLGGTDPRTKTIGIACVSRFINVNTAATPNKIAFHDLRLIGFGRAVANFVQGSNQVRIHHTELYGNGYMYVDTEYFGSGYQFSHTANNIEVDNNLIEETGDSPITPQHFGGATGGNIHHLHIHHNDIRKWGLAGIEVSDFGSGNQTTDLLIEYNRIVGGGTGFSASGHASGKNAAIHFRGASASYTNITIQHNTLQSADGALAMYDGNSTNPFVIDDNRFSSSAVGVDNQIPVDIPMTLTNNFMCANTTQINPSSPGAGSTYTNNTLQAGECYVTLRTTEGVQPSSSGSPVYTFMGLTSGVSYSLTAKSRDIALNESAACSAVSIAAA